MPDWRDNPEGEARLAALRELGGVRSQMAYVRTSRHVSLLWDDKKRTITLDPCQSRASGGFEGIRDAEIVVKHRIGNAELGRAVRRAIAASRSLDSGTTYPMGQGAEGLAEDLAAPGLWDLLEPAAAAQLRKALAESGHPLDDAAFENAGFSADGEDLAEGGVEELLGEMAPALLRHGLALEVTAGDYPVDEEKEDYVLALNGRRCRILRSEDREGHEEDWYLATVRPLAMVNDLLAEAGAKVRVFTLYTGGNEGLAFLLDPEVPAAMARSGLFPPDQVPELASRESHQL